MEKFYLSLRIGVISIITAMAINSTACTYTFKLYDAYGDGWNGGYINILVNGIIVKSNVTLQGGNGPHIETINVNQGDVISTVYSPGNWPEENYYDLHDNSDIFVVRDGCDDYSCNSPVGGFLANAVCPAKDVGIMALQSPMTGCGLTATESVTLQLHNGGIVQADTLILSYSVNGGVNFTSITLYQTLYAGDTLSYTFLPTANFSATGMHHVIITATTPGDENTNNDTLEVTLYNQSYISVFPYSESFEAGSGGWISGGAMSSWALGIPDGPVIDTAATGTQAWVTNLTGPYNDFEQSWVMSPCFDFTGLTNMVFEMKIWCESYQWYDGSLLQYSTDGIQWTTVGNYLDPVNWYNQDWVEGILPFGSYSGWAGSSSQWITVQHTLPAILDNAPRVQLRIGFGSKDYHNGNYDGIAFDDIYIFQPPPMTYTYGESFQQNTNTVGKGMIHQEIMGIKVVTTSTTNPLVVTEWHFNTTGSTSSANIDSARVFYTGSDSAFSTQTPFGQPVKPLSPFTIQGSQALLEGDNYFWLAYDVAPGATTGHLLDAVVDSMEIGGLWHTPVNNNPAGSRSIVTPMVGSYTINPAGGGDYLSLADANADMKNRGVIGPVILNMVPGTYQEKIEFTAISGASAVNTITIQSSTLDSTDVTIQASPLDWSDNWVMLFNNTEHFNIKHLTIHNPNPTYQKVIVLEGANKGLQFRNSIFKGLPAVGEDEWQTLFYSTFGTEDLLIDHCHFLDGSYGLSLYNWNWNGYQNTIITNNLFTNQYTRSINLENHSDILVHNNQLFSGNQSNFYHSINGWSLTGNIRITANTIINQRNGYGIYISSSTGSAVNKGLVANNFISIHATGQYQVNGIHSTYNEHMDIAHNTVNIYGDPYTETYGITFNDYHLNTGVYSNLSINKINGYAIRTNPSSGITSDYNVFYTSGSYLGSYNNNDAAGLGDWQSGTGFDQNSNIHNPIFFSETNLHSYDSGVNGKGTPVAGVTVDIDGDPRHPTTPDAGADEFDLPSQEVSLEGFLSPEEGCGLSMEDITIRIANNGTSVINGGLTAYYEIIGGSTVSQAVSNIIQPGDTLDFTFTTQANLSVISADSTFEIMAYLVLTGDPLQLNDTGSISVLSGYMPPSPTASNTTVSYGNSAILTATGPGTKQWFATETDTIALHTGDTLTTPILYDTTTYWVAAYAANPNTSGINLALSATASHSGGGSGSYGPGNYNDGNIPTYGNGPWGWTSSYGWIEFTWPSPVVINKVKFFKADRPMSTCQIQYYDGTNYITIHQYNNNNIEDSVLFTETTTTKLRFYNIDGYTSPNFREIQVFAPSMSGCQSLRVPATANVVAFPGIDAGITAITTPSGQVQEGVTSDVIVELKNYGLTTLTNVNIAWKLNGLPQGTYTWNGSLAHGATTLVTIASTTFPGGSHCITASTSQPNGLPDNFAANNEASGCFNACLSGTYTIGPSTTGTYDYPNFTSAVYALSTAGICGHVVFDVYPGTYTEQVTIQNIPGTDINNTVTFQGVTTDSNDVILQYTTNSSSLNWVVRLDNASFFTFKHLTIKATGTSYGRVVEFTEGAHNNTLTNCKLQTSTTSTSSNFVAVYSAGTLPSNQIFITNNYLEGGYYSIYWYGNSSAKKQNITITGNTMKEFHQYGAYLRYTDNITVRSNNLQNRVGSSQSRPLYLYYCNGTGLIEKNRIVVMNNGSSYGLYMYGSGGSTAAQPYLIRNNFISQTGNPTGSLYGIYCSSGANLSIVNNSVNIDGGDISFSSAAYMYYNTNTKVINNIFSNPFGGFAYYHDSYNAVTQSDYNNLYTSGNNLVHYPWQFYSTLSGYQSASGLDQNSFDLLPPYTSTHELKLTSTTLSGKGTSLTEVTDDIFGHIRTTTPTIGAHEIPLLPNDAGVTAIITPTPQTVMTEGDQVPVHAEITNFGTSTINSVQVSYIINNGTPVTTNYNTALAPMQKDTVILPTMTAPAGHFTLCSYTSLTGDSNTFNDSTCTPLYALSNIDAELIHIYPFKEGCGLTYDTVTLQIANVATAPIPAGFTASYRFAGSSAIVTETVNTGIAVGDTIAYTFSTLINLTTNADTNYIIEAWLTVPNDNIPGNDSAISTVNSLAIPSPPAVTTPVTTAFGTSTVLDANTNMYTQWYANPTTQTPLSSGSVYVTPVLYDTTIFYVETFFSQPLQEYITGTFDTQNNSTSYPTPYGNWYWGNKEQYLIRGSELTALGATAGDITGLAFNVITPKGTPLNNFTIKMGQTAINEMTGNMLPSLTTVYTTPSYTDVSGWNTYTFSTPINWDGTSNIAVEVCFNNSSYTSNGVVALTSTGFNATVRTSNDASSVCSQTTGGVSSLRPVIKLIATGIGCPSVRVPVTVNVTGIPPLGKPSVTPASMQVTVNGCSGTETRPIRIKNIGTAALQYESFGGAHTIDSTSTQYYHNSLYPDTTTHLFTTIPLSADSLYLEITLNGSYSSSSAFSSLIIEGTNLGVIPDGDVSNGQNIVVLYKLGGSQLQNWLSDGELKIRIANNSNVYPWYGTRMHQVRAYTPTAPWISMPTLTGSIPVGDSVDLQVVFSGTGLPEGVYQSTIPLEFNHPGYPFVKIPVTMTLDGEPDIRTANCIYFPTIMQYTTTTDSVIVYNDGCADLNISNITSSNSAFTPSFTQTVVPPFDSVWLKVTYAPQLPGSYQDTLTIISNDADQKICLDAFALSPPEIIIHPDTLHANILSCNDSITLQVTISNNGTQPLNWHGYSGMSITDNFDPAINTNLWSVNTGTPSGNCGSFSGSNALYFTNNGTREAITHDLNLIGGGNINFQLMISGGSSNCEQADNGEDVKLQYSTNGGSTWTDINTYYTGNFNSFTSISESVPQNAMTQSTRLRWYQVTHSGSGYDNWAIDDVDISNSSGIVNIDPDSGTVTSLSQQTVDIVFRGQGYPAGNYSGNIIFLSNDPLSSTKSLPYTVTLTGAPSIGLTTTGCLIADSTMAGGLSIDTFTIVNEGCDTLTISSMLTATSHFSVSSQSLQIDPFGQQSVMLHFHPNAMGLLQDTIAINSNAGILKVCLEGVGRPAPAIYLSQNNVTVNIINCDDSVLVPVQLSNQGLVDLDWNLLKISGSAGLTGSSSGISIGVYNSSAITNLLNSTPDITATQINSFDYNTIKDFDAIMNIRGSNIDQADVLTYLQNGGAWIGEYSSNEHPFTWGVLSGNIPYNATGGTYGANVLEPNHYLATHIDWNNLPYGSNPLDYMRDLRNLNDPDAVIIATADHSSYPNNPILVEKTIGLGKIIIFNWDYNDNPTYNTAVSNAIIEVARYAATSATWLSMTPTQGTVVPATSTTLDLKFNALGLTSGIYDAHILINSNDPLIPMDTITCTMNIVGAPVMELSHTNGCFEMDTVIMGFSKSDTLYIKNTGCDTLHIYQIGHSLSQYTLSDTLLSILPYDSTYIAITFIPDAAQLFSDNLTFQTNAGTSTLCLNGTGIEAPVISYTPASFSHTFNSCDDSLTMLLKIYNTGIGDLRYNMSNLFGTSYDQTSNKNYNVSGAATSHSFLNTPTVSDTMRVIVTVNGDYDDGSEYCSLFIEGVSMGIVPDGNQSNGTNIEQSYTFSGNQLHTWLSDGKIDIGIVNSSAVDHWSGLVSMHKVQVIIDGVPWLTVSETADTVVTGDSSMVYVTMKTANMNNGTYHTAIVIESNDPVSQTIQIPCTLTVNGPAMATFSEPCLHFGQVMQYSSLTDTIIIHNDGCSPLTITSIYTTMAQYSLSSSYMIIPPGQQQSLIITFQPTSVGTYNDNIHFITSSGSYQVCLTGQGVDASELSVTPASFSKTILNCNDTITDILTVQNLGTGNLTYQVYGGRGLSGDSSILVIRDNNAWNVDLQQFIINHFGISPQVITSSQISATNFNDYDIIITMGGQTAGYYNVITSQVTKFNAFASNGGILLYMLGNYEVNSVTLAGNANLLYGNGQSQNLISDPSHPMVQGLPSPLNGGNANVGYLANLPATAKIITTTSTLNLPTTAEYEVGSGLVIATGMLWEYHTTSSYNMAPMLQKAISYALATIGTSPSWLSFDYTNDTIIGIGNANVTVQFNSTEIPNGTYTSNIIVYSNDPVNPQKLVPCSLVVNGAAQLSYTPSCIAFDTLIQGSTMTKDLVLYNTGCAPLTITGITPLNPEYSCSVNSGTIQAGDSMMIIVSFTPLQLGNRNSTLQLVSNIGTTPICLEGYSINPPVMGVTPGSFDIVINSCQDTVVQTLKLNNTGSGQAIYQMLGLYGTDIDLTSQIPVNTNGAVTTHVFNNLPPNIDSLTLEVTLSGDLDLPNEYAELIVGGTNIGQIDDGNIPAGQPYTDIFGFGGSQLAGWVTNGQLTVSVQNAATVDHWSGLNSYHKVRLKINGNHWINLSSVYDTIPSNDSTEITIQFFSTHMNAGVHHFNLIVGSNDPGNAQVSVPCTLTVNGLPDWSISHNCINFDTIMLGDWQEKFIDIINTGCDTLKITGISSTVSAIVPSLSSAMVLPGETLSLPVTFTPTITGSLSGSLILVSNAGTSTLCLTATGAPAPALWLSADSLVSNLACQVLETQYLKIKNTGAANLHFQMTGSQAFYLTITPQTGVILPGDSLQITVIFDKTGLGIGTFENNLTLITNDPLQPSTGLKFRLEVLNMLSPVNLGPDITVCANATVTLNAGSHYLNYLWDDQSTDSTRSVHLNGTYIVTVTDSNNCPSSDTITVTFYPNPVVHSGTDTSICEGGLFERIGSATGIITLPDTTQIGYTNTQSNAYYITPFTTGYTVSRKQHLYKGNELHASGFTSGWMNAIAFYVGSVGDPAMQNFNISIGSVTQASLINGYAQGLTNVYSSTSQNLSPGWNTFQFTTPFYYNGTDNVVIEICFTNSTYNYSSSIQYHHAGSHITRYGNSYSNNTSGCNLSYGNTTSYRPNIRFIGDIDQSIYTWNGPGGFTSSGTLLRIPVTQQQHSGFYTLSVDNGLGCTGTDAFNLALAPLPMVNAGTDTFIYEGGAYTLSPVITGGILPYTTSWTPGYGLNDSTLTQPIASPAQTTTYTLRVAGNNGCSGEDQVKITVIPRFTINGSFTYNNAAYTPMDNAKVYLKDASLNLLDSVVTDQTGGYAFYLKPPGSYTIHASTTKPWGGVNATDALVVQRHVINLSHLTGLRLKGADVNQSGTVSSVDALLILRRTLGMDTSFAIGNWVFDDPVIHISSSNIVKNFQALASGDVNGSHLPPSMRQIPAVSISRQGIAQPHNGELRIPVSAAEPIHAGAITLFMKGVSPATELLVESDLQGLLYHIHEGKLKVAWSDEQGHFLNPGDPLFTIIIKNIDQESIPDPFWFDISLESEISDLHANVLDPAYLQAPLAISEDGKDGRIQLTNHPNPFSTSTTITWTQTEAGHTTLEMFDVLGKKTVLMDKTWLNAEKHKFTLDASTLPAGIYHCRLTIDTGIRHYRADHSMIIIR